jgi:hypothetical protein
LVPADWRQIVEDEDIWPVPKTEEAYYYRKIYNSMYTHTGNLWPFWMPKWSPETTDPSARTLAPV